MLDASLQHLRCPACAAEGGDDRGRLEWRNGGWLPMRRTDGDVQEGLLACGDCSASYPVLAGLALLVPRPRIYLARFYPSLVASALEHAALSPDALHYLDALHAELPPLHTPDLGRGNAGLYLDEAFAASDQDVPLEPPLEALIEHSRRHGHRPRLLNMLDGAGGRRGLAIDAGCHVGVYSRELARLFRQVFAFDLSFHAALLARRLLLGRPAPLEHFKRYITLRTAERLPLEVPPVGDVGHVDHVEVVVADTLAPPFAASCADLVLSANVLDEIGELGAPLGALCRLPADGGRLAIATSYSSPGPVTSPPGPFSSGQVGPGHVGPGHAGPGHFGPGHFGPEALRRQLSRFDVEVIREQDGVPRVLRNYDRSYSVFLCHCLIGEKGDRHAKSYRHARS